MMTSLLCSNQLNISQAWFTVQSSCHCVHFIVQMQMCMCYICLFLQYGIVSACMLYYCDMVRWAWLDWGLSGWLTTLLQCFDTVGWLLFVMCRVAAATVIIVMSRCLRLAVMTSGTLALMQMCLSSTWNNSKANTNACNI